MKQIKELTWPGTDRSVRRACACRRVTTRGHTINREAAQRVSYAHWLCTRGLALFFYFSFDLAGDLSLCQCVLFGQVLKKRLKEKWKRRTPTLASSHYEKEYERNLLDASLLALSAASRERPFTFIVHCLPNGAWTMRWRKPYGRSRPKTVDLWFRTHR